MKTILKIIVPSLSFLVANVEAAIVLEQEALIATGVEYHSNVQYLDNNNRESVYLFTVVPEYKLSLLDDKNTWFAKVGLHAERSSNHTVSRNREDPFGEIGWERSLAHGMFGIVAGYLKQSSRSTQFVDTGVLTQDGTSVARSIKADWTHLFTEKLELALNAQYKKTKFSGVSELSNFETRGIGSELTYKLDEKFTPYVRFGLNDYRSRALVSNQVKYQNYLVGTIVQLNPKLEINVGTGVVHFSSSGENEWVGLADVKYTGEKFIAGAGVLREVYPTGLGQIVLGDQLRMNYDYNLSEISSWGVGARFGQSDSGEGVDTQEFSGVYDRNLSESWLMQLSLAVNNLKIKGRSSANNNVVGILFTYRAPKF